MDLDAVVALAGARPWAAEPWARELIQVFPDRLRGVMQLWDLTIVVAHTSGAGLPVLEVTGPAGPAVLKLSDAGTDVMQQARILEAADGRGFVRLLAGDAEHGAILIERLGSTLADVETDPVAQTDALLELLPSTWSLPAAVGIAYEPDEKARGLLTLIENAPQRNEPAARTARTLATWLAANPSRDQVVVHGDPHASNALRRGESYALIDPDGFLCEPEYDVGVALRDHQHTIDALDREQGIGAGARWHADLVARAARRTGLDAERIAAWAAVERVTTGIHLGTLGFTDESDAWLATASRMLVNRS